MSDTEVVIPTPTVSELVGSFHNMLMYSYAGASNRMHTLPTPPVQKRPKKSEPLSPESLLYDKLIPFYTSPDEQGVAKDILYHLQHGFDACFKEHEVGIDEEKFKSFVTENLFAMIALRDAFMKMPGLDFRTKEIVPRTIHRFLMEARVVGLIPQDFSFFTNQTTPIIA